jgi:protein phosphatase
MGEQQLMQLKKMNSSFITNKGKRQSNQDVVFIESIGEDRDVFLVADGMGGYKNGEYAANFIVEHICDLLVNQKSFDKNIIQLVIDEVTRALALENEKLDSNMGATLGGVVHSKEVFHCFWVGDVKIMHIRNKKIIYESKEHNLKNELIENKVFVKVDNAKKYNHVVTRAIHNDINKSKIDYKIIEDFHKGDYIIIASDGVTDVMENHQLLEIINSKNEISENLSELNHRLMKSAKDNYSLVLIS